MVTARGELQPGKKQKDGSYLVDFQVFVKGARLSRLPDMWTTESNSRIYVLCDAISPKAMTDLLSGLKDFKVVCQRKLWFAT
eukprot:685132-Amphidinium_carterae.1